MDIGEFFIRLLFRKRAGHDRKSARPPAAPERKPPPPASGTDASGGGGGGGGDARPRPETGVHVSEVADGVPGTAVHKSTGQIKGKVDAMTAGGDASAGRVLHMTDDRGKKLDVRFDRPLASLAQNVRAGDDVTIKLDGAHHRASLENRTQRTERRTDTDGSFTDQPLAPPAPHHGPSQAL